MRDSDDSYDFSALGPFLAELRAGQEVVIGNRFKGGIKPGAMPLLHRYLGNPVLSWIGRTFFSIPIGDFHCGLCGFSHAAIRQLGLSNTGMEFASEMIVKSALGGRRIALRRQRTICAGRSNGNIPTTAVDRVARTERSRGRPGQVSHSFHAKATSLVPRQSDIPGRVAIEKRECFDDHGDRGVKPSMRAREQWDLLCAAGARSSVRRFQAKLPSLRLSSVAALACANTARLHV
jgi:hypothetical protein